MLLGSNLQIETTEMPNLRSSYPHCCIKGSTYTGQSQFPRRIDRDLGFNLWTGSLHQLQVHDPIENPETINRPSVEFPKQRPSQDTNTIFSVHVVSLREVSTRSMSETGFGAIFFLFHRIFHHPKSEVTVFFQLPNLITVNKTFRSWLFITKNWPVVGRERFGNSGYLR